jgi:hypothetical protein
MPREELKMQDMHEEEVVLASVVIEISVVDFSGE